MYVEGEIWKDWLLEVIAMKAKKTAKKPGKRGAEAIRRYPDGDDLRLNPEARVAPRFDAESVAAYTAAAPGKMGFRVIDNRAEENQK